MTTDSFTIVVIEDDVDEAALMRELLERRGYRIIAAATGEQCLDHLAREPVDLVITGIRMPGISGVDLCAVINARFPKLPVIVLSGNAERARAISTIQDRPFAFMIKPVKLDVLEGAIKRALEWLRPGISSPETSDA